MPAKPLALTVLPTLLCAALYAALHAAPAHGAEPAAAADTACPEVPSDAASVTPEQAVVFYRQWEAAGCAAPATKAVKAEAPFTISTQAVTLTADALTHTGLSYDGVVRFPTATGTVRLLRFSMTTATLTNVRQTSGQRTTLTAREFVFSGAVTMYATKITGRAFGLLPMTLTPDAPPPLVPSVMSFTGVTIEGSVVLAAAGAVKGLVVQG
ncbi:hypothetical protein LO762_19090 [Actinocorallia sp. API 0066]|uniref:hypothetical protein n=1 Tax=Actinocorallia sp. API 0066 TaxID=2896846 RepID=UPI001E49491F|nr:hypothetical protein [Actinocorallia sp. API 0066]MCD0451287.1 hypothetical protein [Actinocorallia sp. API 0066]